MLLIALLFAGIAEGIGISAMLPLLTITLGGSGAAAGKKATQAEQMIQHIFDWLGFTPTLEFLLILIFFTFLIKTLLVLFANKRVGYTVAQLTTDLRHQALKAFIMAGWEFHLSQPIGRLSSAMGGETAQTAKAYAAGVSMIVVVIHTMIYIGVAMMVSWKATLVALAAGVLIWYPLNHFVKKARKAGRRQVKLRRSLSSFFVDTIQSMKPLKAMAREDRAEAVLISKTNKLKKALQREIISKESLSAYQEIMLVTFLLIAIYVAIAVWHMAASTVLILIVLLRRILSKLGKIQKQYQLMSIQEVGYWTMTKTIETARNMREKNLGQQKPVLRHAIRLQEVTFAYGEHNILDNASLTFPAGKITAIVGPSGAGKTTIVDLVIGLLRPQKGEIWIDDLPLAEVDIRQWRRMIGYVSQEPILLHDSIFINVTLGDPNVTEKEVREALKKAEVWDFVATMPKGMYSSVGQRGLRLSGGQRQRVAIARALVHQPELLILDEATTALDPKSEAAICATLRRLRGDLTILAISHQPAVLEVADQAYRVQNGTVVPVSIIAKSDAVLQEVNVSSDEKPQTGCAVKKTP
ncbi:MAG: ABC transporter ATP-binding protein [Deltaproteobacteria bacterium]|nr:ABC transporter ATP-binding protein [Deltaproteobacteria bacterium]MBW2069616.1 ABC transporter ATP-binding protein [Deltaproteobacteria bacterium]